MSIFKWMVTACLMAGMTFATVGCDEGADAPPAQDTTDPDITMPADETPDADAPADEPASDPAVDEVPAEE